MNVRVLLRFAVAIGALVAAATVVIVATAFAVYAAVREYLGPAGSAAVVAALFALIVVLIAAILTRKVLPPGRRKGPPEPTLPERAMQLVRERPLIALGAAAAAAVVVVRNPGLLTALVSAFIAGNATRPPDR